MDQPFPGADTYGGECAFDIATKSDDHVLKLVAIAAADEKSALVLDDDGHVPELDSHTLESIALRPRDFSGLLRTAS